MRNVLLTKREKAVVRHFSTKSRVLSLIAQIKRHQVYQRRLFQELVTLRDEVAKAETRTQMVKKEKDIRGVLFDLDCGKDHEGHLQDAINKHKAREVQQRQVAAQLTVKANGICIAR